MVSVHNVSPLTTRPEPPPSGTGPAAWATTDGTSAATSNPVNATMGNIQRRLVAKCPPENRRSPTRYNTLDSQSNRDRHR
ncbi:phosphate-selective porin O and P [Mycolicibacterium thermoresistibile]|uniref:Phosphate-selective porin O and P n=1 Tax=Mycolicibacterium thermoresistibile TaxID=1797 RepID=A0A100XAN1_MYCTH|nr:phosphate-selective porin O and P [Mycolicibacterium thermoresistibile]